MSNLDFVLFYALLFSHPRSALTFSSLPVALPGVGQIFSLWWLSRNWIINQITRLLWGPSGRPLFSSILPDLQIALAPISLSP